MNGLTKDYLSLMNGRDRIGKSPLVFTAYEKAGPVTLLSEGHCTFVFVLQGAIRCQFVDGITDVQAGEMFALDQEKLNECGCTPHTMLMEYIPPQRMLGFLRAANQSFHSSCSDRVQFNKHLYEWCEWLLTKHDTRAGHENVFYNKLCDKLSTLLLQYPQGALGTLYIPLYACKAKQGSCAECFTRASYSAQ